MSYYFAILCCDESNGLARSKNKHREKLTRQKYDGAECRERLRLRKEKWFYLNTPGVKKTVMEAAKGKPFGVREWRGQGKQSCLRINCIKLGLSLRPSMSGTHPVSLHLMCSAHTVELYSFRFLFNPVLIMLPAC